MVGRCYLALAVVLVLIAPLFSVAAYGQEQAPVWAVERAREWDILFDGTSGWTGADGIYSIPLSGVEAHGSAAETHTIFVFSDTFIGDVGTDGRRLRGTTIVNNTGALLRSGEPEPDKINFIWEEDEEGKAAALFVPNTPAAQPGDWYWLCDGASIGGKIYLFAMRMREGDGGAFNFAVDGVALLTFSPDAPDPLSEYTEVDTPLFYVPSDGRGDIIFGNAIMPNTVEAEAPAPDGYVYIYGHQNDPYSKRLVAARVLPEHFDDFSMWRFWDGFAWSPDIGTVAPLAGRISSEFSMSPLPDGRFVLVFQFDTLSDYVAIRVGSTPIGPFGPIIKIWLCPEPALDPDIYTYNAKAHPHLSRPGELLISYNVNTLDFWDHFAYADIYRPRFIRIRLGL
ncbi:MAG: DUF4185 domain-containing protein [Candidatus Abyssobacteria bacterium SURF_5]|uniref:DUF4185 domain-containing protein n=1 Tax=Abyssobacteria bacterium (strain SURF_5) TaxID=2093360 RepID=A0A3A4P3H2_ABYX5|nr:MAG: DUF4185 domain-containing protein [Candidatus Abyssubacteria bacterium SURF_5]